MAVEILPMKLETREVCILGLTPLIVHAFSQKKRDELLDQHMQKSVKKREKKDPMADCMDCFHPPADDGSSPFSFPTMGFKHGIVATARLSNMKMTELWQAVHVVGVFAPVYGMWEMGCDVVRNANGQPDVRHRPYFHQWGARFMVRYEASFISDQQVLNLIESAGFQSGIGDWRPQRKGSYGTYRVCQAAELEGVIDLTPDKLEAA